MVQIDIPAAFIASMLFLDIGKKAVLKDHEKTNEKQSLTYYRFLFRSIFFAGFVIAPAGIYLLAGWPGWEQLYWSRRFEEVMMTGWINALLPTFFIMAIVLAAYLGHIIGYRWIIVGKDKYLRPTYIGVFIVVGVVVLLNYPSFLLIGTYNQYHNLNGQAREAMESVFRNPFGFSVGWLLVMIYFAIMLACFIIKTWKENQTAAD